MKMRTTPPSLPPHLAEALDCLPEAINYVDAEGRLRYWNAAFAAQVGTGGIRPSLGMTSADMANDIIESGLLPAEMREPAVEMLSRPDADYENIMLDGRWMRIRRHRTPDGGTITTSIEITSEKRFAEALAQAAETADAANQAKSAFVATMSHEIRTPLNGVLGMVQAMEEDTLTPIQRERLEVIKQSGAALLALLNDVLDLSKIEAGKLEVETIEFDLGELAHGALVAFTELANKKGISFQYEIQPGASGRYLGDPVRIRQILYNVISNALKFTHEGYVRVDFRREGDQLSFAVTDTGIGIAADKLGALFTRFSQADTSTTRRYGGTGLGLAICRDLARLMAGDITCKSVPGRGTTFAVDLQLRWLGPSIKARASPAQEVKLQADRPERPLRVLVAEDNHINQLVIKTLLLQLNIQPHVVDDGVQALQAWRDDVWDVVLMDVQMPEMDGPTATRAIRAQEASEGRGRTPIVALTANVMSDQTEAYLACGMDACVAKPIRVEELFRALDAVICDNEAA